MEPRTITQAEAADLLASGYETGRYEPLGLFLVGEAGGTWTGIDNSTGHAWTEEFGTQAECLKWLKGENTVFTLDEAVSRIYELSAEAHMNIARNLKERRAWCEKHLKNYQTIKRAFEKVLDIRYAERLEVYRYYYGEREAVRHGQKAKRPVFPLLHRSGERGHPRDRQGGAKTLGTAKSLRWLELHGSPGVLEARLEYAIIGRQEITLQVRLKDYNTKRP